MMSSVVIFCCAVMFLMFATITGPGSMINVIHLVITIPVCVVLYLLSIGTAFAAASSSSSRVPLVLILVATVAGIAVFFAARSS